ncbi:hypothetical protein [Novosphingobium sp. KA1]|uniref:hypothetical protein n=1 Tax=Novosphingobium sp. (strain KA1) TaxID=164608 RepID=UPI001A8D08D1|nr:hypothetical protein [Novosphingobium sp. KA1]QSR16036.1 hypothetical protein CA833_02295 [Novosphingobium sp. KA1]
MKHYEFCGVSTPTLIYAGPGTREEFDQIALPERVAAWRDDEATTLFKNDGQQWQIQMHSKMLCGDTSDAVIVIFQWPEYRAIEAA